MIDKTQSQTIDLLRFPLAVFVVLIHTTTLQLAPLNEVDFPLLSETGIYHIVEIILQRALTIIAVPTFFLMSGFLFFQKLNNWNWSIYKSKMQSRFKTLLIPYLCWITISYVLTTNFTELFDIVSNGTPSEAFTAIRRSIRRAYWDGLVTYPKFPNLIGITEEMPYPLIAPLWFLRDLMVVMVFSPVIYFYLKKTKYWGLLILAACHLTGVWPILHGFSITAFFYFGMGAYLAINDLSIVEVARKLKYIALPMALITLCLLTYFCSGETYVGTRVIPFYILSGVWSAIWISSSLISRNIVKPNRFLVSSCFFIYALHNAPYECDYTLSYEIYNFLFSLLSGIPHIDLLLYILSACATITICLMVFWIIQRISPRLSALLTGMRG